MLIECIIDRVGPTELTYGGALHIFKPRPELTNGDTTAKVCEVTASHAQAHFLDMPGSFRKYTPKEESQEHQEVPASLTKDIYLATKHMPTLRKLIKQCADKGLLLDLLTLEANADNPREWAGQALDARLRELGQ